MSNVTFDITSDDYESVETAASITLDSGTTFSIQGLNNDFYLRKGSTGTGFYVKALEHCTYNSDGTDLEIKKLHSGVLTVNISD